MPEVVKFYPAARPPLPQPAPQPSPAPSQKPPETPVFRRLVRPSAQHERVVRNMAPRRMRGDVLSSHDGTSASAARAGTAQSAGSHAESFYLQKQIQAQTPMVFVLEDGEELCGIIEWFDRETIKIRHQTRTLIFKRAIKYLFKAGSEHEL